MHTNGNYDWLKYGYRLFPWILIIGIISTGFAVIGFIIAGGGLGMIGKIGGLFLILIGGLIGICGACGILYKIITDAVRQSA